MTKHKVKILIADDHPIFRRGLCSIIESDENFKVIAEAENGKVTLELIEKELPDIAILDIDMPVLDGIETAKLIYKEFPTVKTIFLTLHRDKDILNALKKLHVKGYLLKDSAIVEIVNCINQVMSGKSYVSEEILEMLLHISEQGFADAIPTFTLSKLTATEMRILRLIAESKTNKEIADEFFISIRTVENHRFNICSKLKLKGNHSLLKFAFENKKMIFSDTENK